MKKLKLSKKIILLIAGAASLIVILLALVITKAILSSKNTENITYTVKSEEYEKTDCAHARGCRDGSPCVLRKQCEI